MYIYTQTLVSCTSQVSRPDFFGITGITAELLVQEQLKNYIKVRLEPRRSRALWLCGVTTV